MKTTLSLSLLCLALCSNYAQAQDNNSAERQAVKDRAAAIYQQTDGNMGAGTQMQYKSTYSNIHALYPDAPANAVPARPSSPYVAIQNPPCYKYKTKRGLEVMECPGARFLPENEATTETATTEPAVSLPQESNTGLNVNSSKSYSGYYPNIHSVYPQAPRNAVAAWPSSEYTQLQDPPCYKYINKRGLEVMECPGAQFAPEHDNR